MQGVDVLAYLVERAGASRLDAGTARDRLGVGIREVQLGKLIYGAPTWSVEFEDRALAHLRIVIIAKLRRAESFSFSWKFDAAYGSGRSSLWLHPAIPLQFEFYGGREPALNRAWIEELMLTANSPGGLELVPEPGVGDTGKSGSRSS